METSPSNEPVSSLRDVALGGDKSAASPSDASWIPWEQRHRPRSGKSSPFRPWLAPAASATSTKSDHGGRTISPYDCWWRRRWRRRRWGRLTSSRNDDREHSGYPKALLYITKRLNNCTHFTVKRIVNLNQLRTKCSEHSILTVANIPHTHTISRNQNMYTVAHTYTHKSYCNNEWYDCCYNEK